MGAFDSIEAAAPCPHCGDIHYLKGTQTKFFEPEYDEQRWMRPGETYPLAHMPDLEHSEWSRIRDPIDGERFTLLIDFDDLLLCTCDCPLLGLLHFAHAPGQLTLERLEFHDARTDLGPLVDFADRVVAWTGAWATYRPLLRAFEQRPFAERSAALRDALRAPVTARFDDLGDDLGRSTVFAGPTRCESCGDTRERLHYTSLSRDTADSFFGPDWTGGAIMIGGRAPFDDARPCSSVTRLRPPGQTIAILGGPGFWSCGCGAGPARYIARFERTDDALVLVDLALRATDDTSDIDYVET